MYGVGQVGHPRCRLRPDLLQGHVHGAYERDGQVWLDVDVHGFFQTLGERIAA